MATHLALMGAALAPSLPSQPEGFDFSELRLFDTIPAHRDFDVVAMHGLVLVLDRTMIDREGILPGKLYVRESQSAPASMPWHSWLSLELERREGHRPFSQLATRREVVQAIEHPHGGPAYRLASRHVEGPFRERLYGCDLIGKVVGVYLPRREA